MAVVRNPVELNGSVNYIATLTFLCCLSCVVLMLKFRGFKATLNLHTRSKNENDEEPSLSMTGAYRINRDEFYDNPRTSVPPKKLSPSIVTLPPSVPANPQLRPAKSTNDLTKQKNLPVNLNKSANDVSYDPRGGTTTTNNRNTTVDERKLNGNSKEQKKLEKKRQAEEKKRQAEEKARAKAAAQEQAKQEKLRKEREKQAAREAKNNSKKIKTPAPKPAAAINPTSSLSQNTSSRSQDTPPRAPVAPQTTNALPTNQPYPTNTLESSISRSSGPPPYSEMTANLENGNRSAGNISFSKPIQEPPNSWDLISQHRQQMTRPTAQAPVKGTKKNMVMDLQYKLGNDDDNSEV